MKTTLLKLAKTQAELSELGDMLLDQSVPERAVLVGPFQDMVNQLENNWSAAALYYSEAGCQQSFHTVSMLDGNGISFTVDDAQTMPSMVAGAPRPTIYEGVNCFDPATSSITLIMTATTPVQLDDLGRMLIGLEHPGLNSLSDAFYNVYDNVSIEVATISRVNFDDGRYYHVLAMIDEDGISLTADNSFESEAKAKLGDLAVGTYRPFADIIEKGVRYTRLLSALGTHKLRLVAAATGEVLDTEADLLGMLSPHLNVQEDPIKISPAWKSENRLVQTSAPYPSSIDALDACNANRQIPECDYAYVTEDNRVVGIYKYNDITPDLPVKQGQRRVVITTKHGE
jgi:hypothetical protein